jgi:hypothetical protein
MHAPVAERIIHKRFCDSKREEAMRAMNDRARDAVIIMLNEVGLDPGLDHMSDENSSTTSRVVVVL